MDISPSPARRGLAIGGLAALALGGTLTLGGCGSGAPSSTAGPGAGGVQPATLAAATGSTRITVTGTGTVTCTPNQLVLNMGVQVSGSSVGAALGSANDAVSRVTAALRAHGVAAADIQTSGLSIWPNYPNNSQVPSGYGVSESLTATLNRVSVAGAQIDAAVHAGGNATTVSGISLNLTDDSALLASARARAVADAEAKATQYAKALGQPLGSVLSVTDQSSAQPLPQFAASSAAAGKSVPVSPGTQQLSVSVTAVFAA
ncbi:MAG: SIMPL domain-containing protein [Trebonia sp.]